MRGAVQPVCYLQQLLRFDVGVSLQVGLQIGALIKTSLTDGTSVGRLLVVEDLVHRQGARLAETLPTVSALEWLLFGMNVAVISGSVMITTDSPAQP